MSGHGTIATTCAFEMEKLYIGSGKKTKERRSGRNFRVSDLILFIGFVCECEKSFMTTLYSVPQKLLASNRI